jgi:phosphoglucosamine mutase
VAKALFGTDGIRGVAGEFPLDHQTVRTFGAALGAFARHLASDPAIVLGMDTRESGPCLAAEVAAGLAESGVRTRFAGVITTPGIAYLTRTEPVVAGVMISASHNPYRDNGLKVLGHTGYKLPDEQEHELEQTILRSGDRRGQVGMPTLPPLVIETGLDRAYIDHLASTFSLSLAGLTMVVDCANGAASHLAPELFERLGAHVFAMACAPNGRNINQDCGSLHVAGLRQAVLTGNADLGVAFDGDADRAMFVSRTGKIVDGDGVLLLAARHLLARGRLGGRTVVATVMSNLGLERALAKDGIKLVRTPVGDKYVLEEMLRRGAALGGEQSGHVIFSDYATTGDGLLTALRVIEVMLESGRGLDELTADLEIYPQRLLNVSVRERKPLEELPEVAAEIAAARAAFGDLGRVLVRFSGTEPLARVMVEGPDAREVDSFAARIAGAIERSLGAGLPR